MTKVRNRLRSTSTLNLLILAFSLVSFTVFSGLAGCDNAPSTKDTASTDQGTPVSTGNNPGSNPNPDTGNNPPPGGGPTTPPVQPSDAVKNVILLVGSGMGPQQIGEVVQYRRLRKGSDEKLALEKLMDQRMMGMVATNSYLDIVTDTAAANSAIACGMKVRNNTVGLDVNGKPCDNIVEKAQAMNKATGVVSNTRITAPGVAPYLAHHIASEEENDIAAKIFEDPKVDVLLAGGADHLIPQNKATAMQDRFTVNGSVIERLPNRAIDVNPGVLNPGVITPVDPGVTPGPSSNAMKLSDVTECSGIDAALDGASLREDQTNLIENTKSKGYTFVCKGDALSAVAPAADTKLLGIFSADSFPRSPDRKDLTQLPSLADMTKKAIEVLDKKPNGFLLVVQGGMTDQVARENDPGTLLQEGLDFDAAIKAAMDYAGAHDDTLVLVTSDHETGGFGFAYSKGSGSDLTLPSGDVYNAPYNYAPTLRYDSLMGQKKSFYKMTKDLVDQLYAPSPSLTLDQASQMLVDDMTNNTEYKLNLNQAKTVLQHAPGTDNAQTQDFSQFYVGDNVHANLLGRATATQSSAVWASGTSTSTPVLILATGPVKYADRVRGFIDNSDIGKIINAALTGK